jgi:hypothetical protein
MSTQFLHKVPGQHPTITQSIKKDLIEDVGTMRGPNIHSDHYLVKTVIRKKCPWHIGERNSV